MKIGLFVTNQHHLGTDMVAALEEQLAMVRLARERGWDSLFSGQHYLNEGDNQQLQLVPFLARLIAEAGEMTAGLGVLILPLHNPVYVAETVATLDILARGNFVFGAGMGYRDIEFDAFRVPRGERVGRFEECLALVKRLWNGEVVRHESALCKLEGVRMNLRPAQRPHPPIWIAAGNEPAVRRAARLGDAWFIDPTLTFEGIRRLLEPYRAEHEALGRPLPAELPIFREIFCARDKRTAIEQAGPHLLAKYGDYARWNAGGGSPAGESLRGSLEELARGRFILGSPEECYEQLRPYWRQLGVNHLVLRTHWAGLPLSAALSSLRLLSEELLPELRRLRPRVGGEG